MELGATRNDVLQQARHNYRLFSSHRGRWAKIEDKDVDKLAEYMSHVYKQDIRENANGIITAKEYSWHNSASIIQEILGV